LPLVAPGSPGRFCRPGQFLPGCRRRVCQLDGPDDRGGRAQPAVRVPVRILQALRDRGDL